MTLSSLLTRGLSAEVAVSESCSEGLSWGCLSLTRCLSPELTSALPKSSQEHVRSWKVKRCMSRSSKVPRGWDKASMEGSGDKQAGQTHLEKSQRLLWSHFQAWKTRPSAKTSTGLSSTSCARAAWCLQWWNNWLCDPVKGRYWCQY